MLFRSGQQVQLERYRSGKTGGTVRQRERKVLWAPADWPSEPPTEPDKEDPSEDDPTETETSEPNPGTVDPVKLGDIDGDNDVTIVDATVIQRCLVGLVKWDDVNAAAADTDGDGDRTIVDATTIQRFLVGREKTLPIGPPMIAADGTYM